MGKQPFFSIIIATYNSEKTLEYTLKSIQQQSIAKDEVEVIVVDGGSTDATRKIATRYGARLLNNPHKLPEFAKMIGTANAKGHYILRMDSDEEFMNDNRLVERKEFLETHPEVKVIIPNKIVSGRKEICGVCADYMNMLGDPFSYYIYKTKENKIATYHTNIVYEDNDKVIMKFKEGDAFPLADSGTGVLSLDYMRENYANEFDTIQFTCSAYDKVISETNYCACFKNDVVKHSCSSSFSVYLSKLKFRVINNLFRKDESGFSSRDYNYKIYKNRIIHFGLYALIIPIPIIDSIRLATKYKNVTFLLHFVYLYYVCFQIIFWWIIKKLGVDVKNTSFGNLK